MKKKKNRSLAVRPVSQPEVELPERGAVQSVPHRIRIRVQIVKIAFQIGKYQFSLKQLAIFQKRLGIIENLLDIL